MTSGAGSISVTHRQGSSLLLRSQVRSWEAPCCCHGRSNNVDGSLQQVLATAFLDMSEHQHARHDHEDAATGLQKAQGGFPFALHSNLGLHACWRMLSLKSNVLHRYISVHFASELFCLFCPPWPRHLLCMLPMYRYLSTEHSSNLNQCRALLRSFGFQSHKCVRAAFPDCQPQKVIRAVAADHCLALALIPPLQSVHLLAGLEVLNMRSAYKNSWFDPGHLPGSRHPVKQLRSCKGTCAYVDMSAFLLLDEEACVSFSEG